MSIVLYAILCLLVVAVAILVAFMIWSSMTVKKEGFTEPKSSTVSAANYFLDDPGALSACITAADVCGTRDGYFPGSISTAANLDVAGKLTVGGQSSLKTDMDVLRALTVSGMATISGKASFDKTLNVHKDMVSKNATIGTDLDVKGKSTISNDLGVDGNLVITGNATLDRKTTVDGSTTVSGDMQIANALNVYDAATFYQTVTAHSGANVRGNANVTGVFKGVGPATVDGATSFGGKLIVNGELVTGTDDVTITGDANMNNFATFTETVNVGDVANLGGGLQIQSRNGNWTTIGTPNGENVFAGPTLVNDGNFCINKECVTERKLMKIRQTEENLTLKLEEWDTITRNELDAIQKIVNDENGILTVHDNDEVNKYLQMIDMLKGQQATIDSLSAILNEIKKVTTETKNYEVEQDELLSKLENMLKTTNDAYFDQMKDIINDNKCKNAGGPESLYTSVSQKTPPQDSGDKVIFLDRHNVDCGADGAINQFHLTRPSEHTFSYDYTCTKGPGISDPVPKQTPYNTYGDGHVVFLNRHNVECENGYAVGRFQLANAGGGNMQYNYTCVKTPEFGECYDASTSFNKGVTKRTESTRYLDRHDVRCQPKEVMSRIYMNATDFDLKYEYRCCKPKPPPPPPAPKPPVKHEFESIEFKSTPQLYVP